MQLSVSETHWIDNTWIGTVLFLEKKERIPKDSLWVTRRPNSSFQPDQLIAANTGRLPLLSYFRTSNLNYLSLTNQKIGSMQKPEIAWKQAEINNEHIIEYILHKEHFWLQSIYILSVPYLERTIFKHVILIKCVAPSSLWRLG